MPFINDGFYVASFSVGCLMAFVANDRITDTVQSYKETPIRAIRDTEQYFNETLHVSCDQSSNSDHHQLYPNMLNMISCMLLSLQKLISNYKKKHTTKNNIL